MNNKPEIQHGPTHDPWDNGAALADPSDPEVAKLIAEHAPREAVAKPKRKRKSEADS